MDYQKRYQEWLDSEYIDAETREQLRQMATDETRIRESFSTDLEFGTGGLRGIIGPGTNRMNRYTVGKATQGLANYIMRFGDAAMKRGVAIAYDSRHFSREFAKDAALVLNANGITTYLFPELTPTPLLSFAVRELKAIAGIVITASHNPPQYNGYKVYWEDGGQIVPEMAEEVIAEVKRVEYFDQVKTMAQSQAEAAGIFRWIDGMMEDRFMETLKTYSYIDESFRETVANMKIIFTPLHGTGNKPVRRILRELGFQHVYVVPEQELPDANFSTVKYPNPEEKEAFDLAIEMAKELMPDLIIGTDPDCDRIGVVEQTVKGEYQVLTGNQVGVLLTEYLLAQRKAKGHLPANGVVVKTIVTTEMAREVAKKYGIHVVDTLTGFKYIGEKIKDYIATGEYEFIFGFEESYGYLVGTHARDKDAVVAAALVAEMAAYYRAQGISLTEQLGRLMQEYGYYLESLVSIQLEGLEGQRKIQQMLDTLRHSVPTQIGKRRVVRVEDYEVQQQTDVLNGTTQPLLLPKSNVLKFYMDDRSNIAIRPSGTEPKVKIYLSVAGKSEDAARKLIEELHTDVMELIH